MKHLSISVGNPTENYAYHATPERSSWPFSMGLYGSQYDYMIHIALYATTHISLITSFQLPLLGARQHGEKEMVMAWSFCRSMSGLLLFSSSQLSLHPPLVGGGGSPVLGKAVPLQDTPTVFPDHTHHNTPPSNIIPEYVDGTCHLSPRGKMQVVTICLILLGTLSGKWFIRENFQRACDSS